MTVVELSMPRNLLGAVEREGRHPWLATLPAIVEQVAEQEHPHPGAQLTFTDLDGMRITAFLTDTPPGVLPWAARRAGAAAPSACPRQGPDPAGQGTRVEEPALPGSGRERCLARGDPDRDRPGLLEQADLLRRPPQPGQVRDRSVPLPRPASRRAARPQQPSAAPADRPALALGHRHRIRFARLRTAFA